MKNDTISRRAAIDAFYGAKVDEKEWCTEYEIGYNDGIDFAVSSLSVLPPVRSEIIRCKDCRHNGSFDTDCPLDWEGKEYCSFAER